MIRDILHQLDIAKRKTSFSWRRLCQPGPDQGSVPYSSLMRWRQRQRTGLPLWQCPGPKKSVPLNWAEFYPLLRQLNHGRVRTRGAGELYQRFAQAISRRQCAGLVQDERQAQINAMKRIDWLRPGLAWSCDATEYGQDQIIPVQDLASRYRFRPLVLPRLDGSQIALHLETLFRQHGAPLFLKRDNGSPFNHQHVDEVLARFGVLPLNNPPYFPRYNGGMEKSIRDFKTALALRSSPPSSELGLLAEVVAQELNHRPRRCLKGSNACVVFHDDAQRLRWTKPQRQTIFRLLLREFGAMLENTAHGHLPKSATLWRATVESWLRRQGLIAIRRNQNQNVSTTFNKIWSHN
jgi:transposase InsO family protein